MGKICIDIDSCAHLGRGNVMKNITTMETFLARRVKRDTSDGDLATAGVAYWGLTFCELLAATNVMYSRCAWGKASSSKFPTPRGPSQAFA